MDTIENYYIATVVDNNDPDKIGRVRVKINHLHYNIPDSDCPWAYQDRSFTSNIPEVGDKVRVYFEEPKHFRYPFYTTKITLSDYHGHNQSIGSMSGSYPNVKYIRLKNGVSIAINSSETEASIVAGSAEIYISPEGEIHLQGSNGSLEFALLGETTQTFLKDILTAIISHVHASPVGNTSPPNNASNFTQLLSIDAEEILSKKVKNS